MTLGRSISSDDNGGKPGLAVPRAGDGIGQAGQAPVEQYLVTTPRSRIDLGTSRAT